MGVIIFLRHKDELNDVMCSKINDITRDNHIKLIKLLLEKQEFLICLKPHKYR